MAKAAAKGKKEEPKKPASVIGTFLLIVIVVAGLAAAFFISRFDINTYRPKIAESVSNAAGREIKIGPVSWSVSLSRGLSIAVKDITVSNPSWASRPLMARIGRAYLHLNLPALLDRKIDVTAFELEQADVQLESGANGAVNWEFKKQADKADKKEAAATESKGAAAEPISLNVREVTVSDSRFGFKGKDGALSLFDIPKLTYTEDAKASRLHFSGKMGGLPMEVDLAAWKLAALGKAEWPFNLHAVYAVFQLNAQGNVGEEIKRVNLDSFSLESGPSKLIGKISVSLSGARPAIKGKIEGRRVDLADFKFSSPAEAASKAAEPTPSKGGKKIFSRDPLPLDGLKAADVAIDLSIDELVVGLASVQDLKTKLDLEGGKLALSPFEAQFAGAKTEGKFLLNAATRNAQLTTALKAKDMDMSQALKVTGASAVIGGKADVDFDLTASGQSSYELASSANGTFNLLMDAGTLSSNALKDIASGMLNLFAPGAGTLVKPGINCLAGRYKITNGLVETKGLLIDTDATTIAGGGTINLPDEHINMSLFTKPKVLGIGNVVPPMKVYGDLSSPTFTMDAGGALQKVTGLLIQGSTTESMVPNLLSVPPGTNACAATIDNPSAAKAQTQNQPGKVQLLPHADKVQETVKGVGQNLLKGLGGLLGQ